MADNETPPICHVCEDRGTLYVRVGEDWEPIECRFCPPVACTTESEADRG